MKITTYLLVLFTTIFQGKANGQDLSGIYVDGVKVDSIHCWSFKEMKLVFPIKDLEKWKKYERIQLGFHYGNFSQDISFFSENIDDYLLPGSDYAVWRVMKDPKTDGFAFSINGKTNYYRRVDLSVYQKACRTCEGIAPYTRFIHLEIKGASAVGYENDSKGDIVKKYGNEVTLYKSKLVPLFIESVGVFSTPSSAKTLSDPNCVMLGQKVDLPTVPAGGYVENLELIMGMGNPSSTNNDVEKIVVTTTTVRLTSQLKPLDKTNSSYFEEKDSNGKLMRAGYKNNGKYHGEVREYSNGLLEQITVYSNAIEDGLFLQFDGKGKLQVEATYSNGQLNGPFKTYNNGILVSTKTFVNGKEN